MIGLRALVSPGPGLDREHAGDRRDDADGAGGEREHEPERRIGADRVERGDTEDDRRDERDLVALEQVGGHAGAVADVVADVVGDRGRVARVVLGDAGLDLADEVGADVGRLGEDAAADAEEQGEQRPAEAEADEDRRRRVLEGHDDHGRAEQAEADGEHAGHAAGAERHGQGVGHRSAARRGRRAHVAPGGEGHADVAGQAGRQAARAGTRPCARRRTSIRPSATTSSGLTISVDVRNTIAATGMRITAIVLNCRLR